MNTPQDKPDHTQNNTESQETAQQVPVSKEIGGRKGPEPTRFGDWELNGKCVDF